MKAPGARGLIGQLAHNRTVLLNAGAMMSTTLVTALLGAAFWLVAARDFAASAVGVASAAVAAMTLLGYLATVGLGTLLMGELPRRQDGHRGLLNAALVVSSLIGVVLGFGFALIAPLVTPPLSPLSGDLYATLVFAVAVGLTALASVLDQALIGLMRGSLQLQRNVVFSVFKLLVLVVLAVLLTDAGAVSIYSAWTSGIAVSLLVLVQFYRRRGEDTVLRPRLRLLAEMRLEAATHHVYNLAIRAPDLVLPLIVVSLLSADANANFYIAWMIAGFGFMIPISLSSVLFAVGSGDSSGLPDRYRLSVGLSAALGLAVNLVLLVLGGPVLALFGASYEAQALGTLHVLALGVFPETIKAHFISISRVERRIGRTMPIVIAGTALELGGAVAGGLAGSLVLVSAGWLAAVCLEAAVMSPTVLRFVGLWPRRADLGVSEAGGPGSRPCGAASGHRPRRAP